MPYIVNNVAAMWRCETRRMAACWCRQTAETRNLKRVRCCGSSTKVACHMRSNVGCLNSFKAGAAHRRPQHPGEHRLPVSNKYQQLHNCHPAQHNKGGSTQLTSAHSQHVPAEMILLCHAA
jgi:hypothetical protein